MLQNPSSSPTNKLPPKDVLELPPKQLELSHKENGPARALKFSHNAESLVKYTLPEVGERIASTPQLVYCLSLLRPSLVSKEGLGANELDWSQARANDPDEQNRLQTMATDLIKAFVRDELKKPGVVAEVVSLAAVLDQDDFKKLLQIFVDGIDQSVLLNAHLLDGLAQLIRNATQEYIDPDDLVTILELLNKCLKDTHDQSTQNKYRLAMAISAVLDSMVDTQVEDLSREQLHEPLSDYLKQLQESSDSCLVYQAAYANQALQHISDDETFLRTAIRRTGKVIQGVSGVVSAVKAIDIAGFIDGLQGIQQSLTGAGKSITLAMDTYANVKALAESGQELLESLKEGSSFTRKSAWYPALRGLDRFLQEGRFLEFEKLVREAPCRHDLIFQWGVCQRLGEIAVGTFWDTDIRKSAVSFLGELYEDDATWGQHTGVKSWILRILSQLVDLSEGVIADETQTLLRLLETDGSAEKRRLYQSCKKDQPGPFIWMTVLSQQESLLLDRVQNKPDVETPLRQLRRERLKGRDEDVYVSPRAKPSLRSTEDFDLTSKVQEFLDGNKKVLLILGDSGAGKSTFNRALEINLWDKYNMIDGQIPLFIHLPTIDKPEHDLITKHLRKVDFTETQIRELKLHREFVLICDGYDESQQTRNLYTSNQLNQAEGWRARMVISCRTEYINVDYKDCFQPVDPSGSGIRDLFQEAVIAPFNKNQIQDYVDQYLMLKKSPWESKDFLKAFKQIPNLQDLVKNPFLLKLALEVLPELLNTDSVFSSAHITRVGLYDEFIGQWIDRNKIRLGEIELSSYDKEALKVLLDSGFKQCGVMYFKELVAAIYDNQDGNPVINYTPHRDRRTWKEELFNNDDGRNLLREAIPLTRNGDQFRFIHKSVLEYGLTLAVFDPSEHTEDREPVMDTSRRGSTSSVLSFEAPVSTEKSTLTTVQSLVDSPLGRRVLVSEESILRFFVDRARDQPVFKDQLLSTIERSKTDKSARIAAANSITILVRAGVQFNGADLRGIKIPGADLSFGVFDSAQLGDADLRKVIFRNVWLRQADLSGAQMKGAQFGELPFLEESCMVNSGAFSPDGGKYAVGLVFGSINLYETSSWNRVQSLKGHNQGVGCIVFSQTGDQIVSGGWDGTVRLWNVETGDCVYTLQGHSGNVTSIMYSPKGDQIISGSHDSTVRLWDIGTGDCVHTLQGHSHYVTRATYSPKGDRIASGSWDTTVCLWDVATGDCVHVLRGHSNQVDSIAYSPKGDRIASGGSDMTVRLWDAETGDCIHILEGHSGRVTCITYSPRGDQIASGSCDKTVRLWDAETGNCIHTMQKHSDQVKMIAYSPKGDQIASGSEDHTIRLWDVDTSDCLQTLQGHTSQIAYITYSPKGDIVVSGSVDKTVRLWNVGTGDCTPTFQAHNAKVNSVVYSPSGCQVASGSWDKTVRLWDVESGDCIRTLQCYDGEAKSVDKLVYVTCVLYSPKGDRIASKCDDQTIRLWDVDTGGCIHIFRGHSDDIWSVAYSPTGTQVASGSWDWTVRLWDTDTGDCVHTLRGHGHNVVCVVYSPKGDRVASASWDSTVRLWDVDTGNCLHVLKGHTSDVHAVAYSPKGDQIASASSDMTVRLWNTETGDCVHTLEGHNYGVRVVAYSPNGDQIASGSPDRSVRLWDVDTGACIHILKSHKGYVDSIAYSPKGEYIASGSQDKTVRLWDVASGQCLATISDFNGGVGGVALGLSLGDLYLVTGSDDGSVRRWKITDEHKALLHWSSSHAELTVSGASFDDRHGLSQPNVGLLNQRRALVTSTPSSM